jgi:hypothetical protein
VPQRQSPIFSRGAGRVIYEEERAPAHGTGEAAEAPGNERLLRQQAASIAHYKKMYDRSSALARIGVWKCDLATETLTWTDGVYDLFELPRGSRLDRARIVGFYDEESRGEMERLRAAMIRDGGSFQPRRPHHNRQGQ